MPGRDFAEQPLVGFNYDYWFACVGCRGRVKIPADEYERQSTMQALYTQCDCSTEVASQKNDRRCATPMTCPSGTVWSTSCTGITATATSIGRILTLMPPCH